MHLWTIGLGYRLGYWFHKQLLQLEVDRLIGLIYVISIPLPLANAYTHKAVLKNNQIFKINKLFFIYVCSTRC